MRIFALSVFGIVLAVWAPYRGAVGRPTPVVVQDDVKQVYLNKCSVCHGEDGAGKTAKGKKLKVKDIRLPEVQKLTPAQWADAIIKGSGQDMDAFGKELGVEMSRRLSDYMRELAKK